MVRGEVYELHPARRTRGHEQQGRRFGVVVQSSDLSVLSTVIVAPTSQRALPASFRPEVVVAGERTRVLVEQIGAVDHSRLGSCVDRLGWQALQGVDEALARVLGLAV